MHVKQFAPLVSKIVAARLDSVAARDLRMRAERMLMDILNGQGMKAVEAAVSAIRIDGRAPERLQPIVTIQQWRLIAGAKTLEISANENEYFKSVNVNVARTPVPVVRTPAQRKRDALSDAFY